jgi:hypothetical protein
MFNNVLTSKLDNCADSFQNWIAVSGATAGSNSNNKNGNELRWLLL